MIKPQDQREEILVRLGQDNRLAHQVLFSHRHPDDTPEFHYEIIDDLHGPSTRVLELAFRGAGKSTIAEEYICIDALFRRFSNFIIVGESFTRAAERLSAIKHELDFNEHIHALFGSQHGPVWNEDKVVLANGVVIQAFGRGQSLRGVKHNDARPDGCLLDDLEDEESVNTPDGRDKTYSWLMRTLLPALAPRARVRMLANMLDPDCLAVRLRKTGMWTVREYPWEYISPEGCRTPTWAARFPLAHIDETRTEYEKAGMLNEYQQEYMVEAVDPSTRVFTSEIIKVVPQTRRWEPTFAFYDPARTVKASSAHTGKVVFSWVGNKLIVWEGEGQLWMPDKIIEDMFQTWWSYGPIEIGVERDGLEEFIMQPLRSEQTRQQTILPAKAYKAPTGKLAFIRGLQPFFSAGDVVFARELPILKQQLLSFPTGRIDVPNALAYALRMRPGLPIYENFTNKNVQEDIPLLRQRGAYLVLNATRQYTTGVVVQVSGTGLRLCADFVREGDPGTTVADIFAEVDRLVTGMLTVYAPPNHWQGFDTIGLQAAIRKAKRRLSMGGDPVNGREELRKKLETLTHGEPALVVSSKARWVINAFSGGYARSISAKAREVVGTADDGPYKTLMEGLESFIAVSAVAVERDGEDKANYAIDAQGRRYLSARASHRG
jgi:hypothetical protein